MSSATSLKHQQPIFMALKTIETKDEHIVVNKQKSGKIDKGILSTWIVVFVLTILFWYFILNLFI